MSENESTEVLVEQSVEHADETTDTKIAHLVDTINGLKNNIGENIIEIGVALLEVRELFKSIKKGKRGSWGEWLKNNVDFTHQTANKFMECAKRFRNYAPARNFNSAQMFELLALPSEESKTFIESKNNQPTPVKNMKKLELRNEIKKWKLGETSTDNSPSNSSEITGMKDFKRLKRLFKMSSELNHSEKFEDLIQAYAKQHHDTIREDLEILQKIVDTLSKNIPQSNDQ